MPAHQSKPSQLRDDYEDMLADLIPLIAPYLPASVKELAIARANRFQASMRSYATIDDVFRAFRANGMPTSHRHRAKQLVDDWVATLEAAGVVSHPAFEMKRLMDDYITEYRTAAKALSAA